MYQDKYLLAFAIKAANKAKKQVGASMDILAIALFDLFQREKFNDKAKKLINYQVDKDAEVEKDKKINEFIDTSRKNGEYFYLASSHGDCAEDHKPYQGKLYVDEKAPQEVIEYAKSRNMWTVQWVMGKPAWFITRPHCRHYFVSLTERQVRGRKTKNLIRKYKTHTKKGDCDFQTPAKAAVAEYEDRLKMLRYLYGIYKTQKLKNEILKTELLLKKWKNAR